MPRADSDVSAKPKPEMIREVLTAEPDLAAAAVQAAVWDQFAGEVTAQEIAHVRKKMRQASAAETPPAARPKPRSASRRTRPKPGPVAHKKPAAGAIRAKDFDAADVTVKQLSAILEVANEVGGLRRLNDALRAVMLLRNKVGAVDERQLAVALDFLARLTRRK
jgi:hypothetical protein